MARYYPRGSGWNPHDEKNAFDPANFSLEDNRFATWLYTAEWNDENLRTFELLYSVEPTKSYIDYLLNLRDDRYYLDRYGITDSDIRDPRKLGQVSAASRLYGYSLNFISDSAKFLYK